MPLDALLGKPPRMRREVRSRAARRGAPSIAMRLDLREAVYRVLRLPAVADKTFLITIGDRTVGGLISRDQLVGPWQVPVARRRGDAGRLPRPRRRGDGDRRAHAGGAAGCGRPRRGWRSPRRSPISWRPISRALSDVRLSANWMAACGEPGEDAALYAAVRAVGEQLCPALGIAIPVGKDSLSMQTALAATAVEPRSVIAPVSLIVSAFAPVRDVRRTLTPVLQLDRGAYRAAADRSGARPQSPRHERAGAGVQRASAARSADLDDPALLAQLRRGA